MSSELKVQRNYTALLCILTAVVTVGLIYFGFWLAQRSVPQSVNLTVSMGGKPLPMTVTKEGELTP